MTERRPNRRPATESEVLKARYDEARAIKDAWDHRLRRAHIEHAAAQRYGGDTEAAQRNITAVQIQVTDAAGELAVALQQWVQSSTHTERRAS